MIRYFSQLGQNRGGGGLSPSVLAKALYYGKISDISGGHMPNLVTGATDYITVGGSAGSYTFRVPNTAPYIDADTDGIWFTGGNPNDVTESTLVSTDYLSTPVKFGNVLPNEIKELIIFDPAEVLTTEEINNLTTEFELYFLWSGEWNDLGFAKNNR